MIPNCLIRREMQKKIWGVTAADGGSGSPAVPAAVFLIQIFFTYQPKKILFQYLQNHWRSTVFNIYLDIREFEKND